MKRRELTPDEIADNIESRNALARLDIMERRQAAVLADPSIRWRLPRFSIRTTEPSADLAP